MLKIKDNVDLKELEKFGFKKYCDYGYYKTLNSCAEILVDKLKNYFIIGINYFNADLSVVYDDFDILFDLIEADMVEKVED